MTRLRAPTPPPRGPRERRRWGSQQLVTKLLQARLIHMTNTHTSWDAFFVAIFQGLLTARRWIWDFWEWLCWLSHRWIILRSWRLSPFFPSHQDALENNHSWLDSASTLWVQEYSCWRGFKGRRECDQKASGQGAVFSDAFDIQHTKETHNWFSTSFPIKQKYPSAS